MALGLIGKKLGMTRVFDKEAGIMIAVTVVDVAGNEYVCLLYTSPSPRD